MTSSSTMDVLTAVILERDALRAEVKRLRAELADLQAKYSELPTGIRRVQARTEARTQARTQGEGPQVARALDEEAS